MTDIIKNTTDFRHPKAKCLIERFNPDIYEIAPRTHKMTHIMKDPKNLIKLVEENETAGIINPYHDYIISAACLASVDYELSIRNAFMLPNINKNILQLTPFRRRNKTADDYLQSAYDAERLIDHMIDAQQRFLQKLT